MMRTGFGSFVGGLVLCCAPTGGVCGIAGGSEAPNTVAIAAGLTMKMSGGLVVAIILFGALLGGGLGG